MITAVVKSIQQNVVHCARIATVVGGMVMDGLVQLYDYRVRWCLWANERIKNIKQYIVVLVLMQMLVRLFHMTKKMNKNYQPFYSHFRRNVSKPRFVSLTAAVVNINTSKCGESSSSQTAVKLRLCVCVCIYCMFAQKSTDFILLLLSEPSGSQYSFFSISSFSFPLHPFILCECVFVCVLPIVCHRSIWISVLATINILSQTITISGKSKMYCSKQN